MSEQVTAVIADDEAPARQLLSEYLERFPQIQVVGTCTDGEQAVRVINEQRPALAFLDIHMPTLSGLDLLTRLEHIPRVVFTTAHAEFAVRAFEVNAVDYILKPYDFERFSAAVHRALDSVHQDEVDRLVSLLHDVRSADAPSNRLFLKVAERIVAVPTEHIRWLEAEGDYTRVHTRDGTHFCSGGLGALETRLDPSRFLRVHRSSIICLDSLIELSSDGEGGYVARLDDDTRVRVSRTHARSVRALIDGH
ncbi:MAG TPA: LytTR family DNA-binding domain-containing protein [Candidatus Latescibacteria bacterium]|jgi:two-component system LytT family response regulator|nr:DNA-binding response regulator [Gemmatimonadaceae bacterium]MDP6015151.1 LytTR family DNA-binding domain-containing protein [Candidatus Latescibacterota bacterium]HJP33035.1 LytTR family DNA-binding domain-containing protein [Candidatus Latescibacterota bacterium]|tara:strand:- start:466 stop:1218 length:753 start_codon:yes stop_codon:yes gene_type:complete